MCFGGSKGPDPAETMRKEEDERQRRVRSSTQAINAQFSRFDPAYFNTVSDAVRAYYNPMVDDQYKAAQRRTTFRFADNPVSSAAARTGADLTRDYGRARQQIELQAQGAAQDTRRQVESERSRLITLAEAGGTQENVAAQAAAAASANYKPTSFNPVTDFFREYTAQLANANIAQSQGYSPASIWTSQTSAFKPRRGASNIVGD